MKYWETTCEDIQEVMDRNGFSISNSEASAILDFLNENSIQDEVLASGCRDDVEAKEIAFLAIESQLEDLNYI